MAFRIGNGQWAMQFFANMGGFIIDVEVQDQKEVVVEDGRDTGKFEKRQNLA